MENKIKFAEIYIPYEEKVYLLELFYDDGNDHYGKIGVGEKIIEYKRDKNKSIQDDFTETMNNYFLLD